MATIKVGQQVQVPVDPNGRVATVTQQSGLDRWRIDWYEPITHQSRWAWWDGPSLQAAS